MKTMNEQQEEQSDSRSAESEEEYLNKEEILRHLRYSSQWNAPAPGWVFRVIENMHGIIISE